MGPRNGHDGDLSARAYTQPGDPLKSLISVEFGRRQTATGLEPDGASRSVRGCRKTARKLKPTVGLDDNCLVSLSPIDEFQTATSAHNENSRR